VNGTLGIANVTGRKVTTPEAPSTAYGGIVAPHDGNGWVECRCGQRHWGRHGAAGLLLARPAQHGAPVVEVLLQLRAGWTHQGGSWALPGGARDSHEDAVGAALREAREETGVAGADLRVMGLHPGTDHVDWSYTYVLALALRRVTVAAQTTESEDLRWLSLGDVETLPLLPAFGTAWPALRSALMTAVQARPPTMP
jgi:8-oxo-dGTP pyrophosphatase MutT (NUDIX family)